MRLTTRERMATLSASLILLGADASPSMTQFFLTKFLKYVAPEVRVTSDTDSVPTKFKRTMP